MEIKLSWSILARRCWQTLLWATLGFFSLIWIRLFWSNFLPRFEHLTGVPIGPDAPCLTPECDFVDFWPAGFLARSGEFLRIYKPEIFQAFQRQELHQHTTANPFLYPPFTLLPTVAVSWLPFELAFFVWTAAILTGSIFCLRYAGLSWKVIAFGMICPAALWSTEMGQLSVLAGSILIAGWSVARRTPLLAGALLGALACKPQAGLLVPFVLVFQKNYRGVLWFFGSIFFLFILTLIVFGPMAWVAYHQFGKPAAMSFLTAPFVPFESYGGGISVFWMMRSFGISVDLSFAVQSLFLITAILLCFKIWTDRTISLHAQVAMATLLSLLASPYGYINDMFAGTVMLWVLAADRGWKLYASDVLFWLWPIFCLTVTGWTGILFTPVVVVFSFWRIAHEAGLFKKSRYGRTT